MADQGQTYKLTLGTRELTLDVEEAPTGTVVPERLVKALNKAQVALDDAEADIARWVKYSQPFDAAGIQLLIDQLEPLARKK